MKKSMKTAGTKLSLTSAYDVVRTPIITEKATFLSQYNQYSFKVSSTATKPMIASAVSQLFKVDVVSVQTVNVHGKSKVFKGRHGVRSDFKKAIVRLKAGQTIDVSVGI